MSTATITSKGQVTIPRDIREKLDLRQGDRLVFYGEDGKAVVHPLRRRDIREPAGIVKNDGRTRAASPNRLKTPTSLRCRRRGRSIGIECGLGGRVPRR